MVFQPKKNCAIPPKANRGSFHRLLCQYFFVRYAVASGSSVISNKAMQQEDCDVQNARGNLSQIFMQLSVR